MITEVNISDPSIEMSMHPDYDFIVNLGGVAGTNAYVYIAWASDSSGTNFTTTFNAALDYIAIKSTNVAILSPAASDFTGLWKKYKGEVGATGAPGGLAGHLEFQEVPTGARNGSNKSFTLAHTPTSPVIVIYNGLEFQDTVDYSSTGTALTLITIAPNDADGDRFWVRYTYE